MLQHSSDVSAKYREPLVILATSVVGTGVMIAHDINLRHRYGKAESGKYLDAEQTHSGMQPITIAPLK